ncbi:MAG: M48 family metallopeptidase [Candidatus Glassbacteria bacterium]
MYEQIASNKRLSAFLSIAVIIILVILGFLIGEALIGPGSGRDGIIVAAFAGTVLGLISYFSGGSVLLAISGAKEVEKKDHPVLFNVVEEMTIAAGVPMPRIFIIEDTATNAFATGRKPEKAAVTVTRGLLDKLNRDQLQGVIAHELSHIRNYDVLFATVIAIEVGLIALICDFFLRYTFWGGGRRRRGGRGGSYGAIIFLIALILAILAPLFSKILQLAISRKREFLADASAAELTRYPEGLASALEVISKDEEKLEAANRATQHLYIVNPIKGLGKSGKNLFSTHPPVEERIKRLREMR